jgi:fermentation-respiration switch protein FrsA (DUF1100 family)
MTVSAEPRTDVSFQSHGLTCRGWYYAPSARAAAPAIVMSHGFSAVKEQYLDAFARRFHAAGFAVLVFDYRYLGASDGEPRGRIVPAEQHDDLRAALAWLALQPEVDPARIGLWGTSYSGGHALVLGALDPRVKVVAAQVPAIDLMASIVALAGRDGLAGLLGMFVADHAARNAGLAGMTLPVVAPPGAPSIFPTDESHAWFTGSAAIAPSWKNEVAVESVARLIEYAPGAFIHLIAPKPLLIQAATRDSLIPIAQVRDAFARAGEPKRLDLLECGHFDCYVVEPWHERAVSGALGWFKQHL